MPSKKITGKSYVMAAIMGIAIGLATLLAYYYFVQLPVFVCFGNPPVNYIPPQIYPSADIRILIIAIIDIILTVSLYQKMFSKNLALIAVFIILLVLTASYVGSWPGRPICSAV